MAMFKFNEIDDAFEYVSFCSEQSTSVLLCLDTGKSYCSSEMADVDDIEIADEAGLIDWDHTAYIPHKNDLDLGRDLVFEFVEKFMNNNYNKVRDMFRGRGAYSRYKNFLHQKGKLQQWHDYETARTQQALLEWCVDNKVEVEDPPSISDILNEVASPTAIPCEISYVEFPSVDIAITKAFFSKTFNWTFTDFGPDYTAFAEEGVKGGFYASDSTCSTSKGSALIVLYSDQLEAVGSLICENGGSIVKPIFEFPGGRRFHFADPNGNEYAVWSDVK